MKKNIFSVLFLLLKKRPKSVMRIFIGTAVLTVLITALIITGLIIKDEYKKITYGFQMTVVFDPNIEDNEIYATINSIDSKDWSMDLEYISADDAQDIFCEKYDNITSELLPANPFPPTLKFRLSDQFFTHNKFTLILNELNKTEGVTDVFYRASMFDRIVEIKEKSRKIIEFTAAIGMFLFLFFIYMLVRTEFTDFDKAIRLLAEQDVTNAKCVTASFFLVIIVSAIGIAAGEMLPILLIKYQFTELALLEYINKDIIIRGSVLMMSSVFLMTLISSLFLKRRA